MTDEEKIEVLKGFAEEIMNCRSKEKAQEIETRVAKFYEENEIPYEIDYLIKSGYGEALDMMTS